MVQATDDDATSIDNVHPFPGAGAEPLRPDQSSPRDPTGAERQARFREQRKRNGKKKGKQKHKDGARTVTPLVTPADARPNAPTVTQFAAPESVTGRSVAVRNAAQDAASVTAPENGYVTRLVTLDGAYVQARDADARPIVPSRRGVAVDLIAYTAAIALAGAAAWFSIRGMVVLFPGSPNSVIAMAVAMEAAKLITAGWLARRWRATALIWRAALVVFVFGLAVINAAGVYAQLVAAHVGDRGAATSRLEEQTADIDAKISVQAHTVADLDRRLAQIDAAVEKATEKGRTTAAMKLADDQRRARAGLVDERKREAGTLAALQAQRAGVAAKGRQIETEAAPIRYVAELVGADTDSEKAIRWLIALMVLCCDPLAIALTAAASARRS
jgi:hypothetical protein